MAIAILLALLAGLAWFFQTSCTSTGQVECSTLAGWDDYLALCGGRSTSVFRAQYHTFREYTGIHDFCKNVTFMEFVTQHRAGSVLGCCADRGSLGPRWALEAQICYTSEGVFGDGSGLDSQINCLVQAERFAKYFSPQECKEQQSCYYTYTPEVFFGVCLMILLYYSIIIFSEFFMSKREIIKQQYLEKRITNHYVALEEDYMAAVKALSELGIAHIYHYALAAVLVRQKLVETDFEVFALLRKLVYNARKITYSDQEWRKMMARSLVDISNGLLSDDELLEGISDKYFEAACVIIAVLRKTKAKLPKVILEGRRKKRKTRVPIDKDQLYRVGDELLKAHRVRLEGRRKEKSKAERKREKKQSGRGVWSGTTRGKKAAFSLRDAQYFADLYMAAQNDAITDEFLLKVLKDWNIDAEVFNDIWDRAYDYQGSFEDSDSWYSWVAETFENELHWEDDNEAFDRRERVGGDYTDDEEGLSVYERTNHTAEQAFQAAEESWHARQGTSNRYHSLTFEAKVAEMEELKADMGRLAINVNARPTVDDVVELVVAKLSELKKELPTQQADREMLQKAQAEERRKIELEYSSQLQAQTLAFQEYQTKTNAEIKELARQQNEAIRLAKDEAAALVAKAKQEYDDRTAKIRAEREQIIEAMRAEQAKLVMELNSSAAQVAEVKLMNKQLERAISEVEKLKTKAIQIEAHGNKEIHEAVNRLGQLVHELELKVTAVQKLDEKFDKLQSKVEASLAPPPAKATTTVTPKVEAPSTVKNAPVSKKRKSVKAPKAKEQKSVKTEARQQGTADIASALPPSKLWLIVNEEDKDLTYSEAISKAILGVSRLKWGGVSHIFTNAHLLKVSDRTQWYLKGPEKGDLKLFTIKDLTLVDGDEVNGVVRIGVECGMGILGNATEPEKGGQVSVTVVRPGGRFASSSHWIKNQDGMMHRCNTESGDCGRGVVNAAGQVVGIHEGTHGKDEGNFALIFKPSWFGEGRPLIKPEARLPETKN